MGEDLQVHIGDHVRISLHKNPAMHSEGQVYTIKSDADPRKIQVVLTNGDWGTVIRVLNSAQIIEERIMTEGQYTENKENFGIPVMRHNVIPKTVQSFLNSDGGYVYIGIRDTGSLEKRLAGLEHDFAPIREKYGYTETDKLCDQLGLEIMAALEKYLAPDAALGPLVSVNFPVIHNVTIAEIAIKKSPHPWFYKNLDKNNKEKKFQTFHGGKQAGERFLDDFYIRQGNGKKRLDTMREFYEYAKDRFINP